LNDGVSQYLAQSQGKKEIAVCPAQSDEDDHSKAHPYLFENMPRHFLFTFLSTLLTTREYDAKLEQYQLFHPTVTALEIQNYILRISLLVNFFISLSRNPTAEF
jgi:hypothetical protein